MYKPNWQQEFKHNNPDPRSMDSKNERRACDIMIDQKENEMRNSKRAQQWEADRKREWREYQKQKTIRDKTRHDKLNEAKKKLVEMIKAKRNDRKR